MTDAGLREQIERLAALRGERLGLLPELSYLVVRDSQGVAHYFTLVKDTGHRNVTHLLLEQNELAPEENALTVVPGLIGAYPNAFFRLEQRRIAGIRPGGRFPEIRGRLPAPERSFRGPSNGSEVSGSSAIFCKRRKQAWTQAIAGCSITIGWRTVKADFAAAPYGRSRALSRAMMRVRIQQSSPWLVYSGSKRRSFDIAQALPG